MSVRLSLFLIVTLALFSCGSAEHQNEQNLPADKKEQKQKEAEKPADKSVILFFGNSLTAGYGLANQNEAFPSLIQAKIDSLKLPYQVVNAGLSGETSADGNARIDWLLKQPIAIFVLELGANDGLRGIPTETTYTNLNHIVEKVKAKNPACQLLLAGMLVPPSMGKTYSQEFKAIFPRLAKEQHMTLIPFLLDGVAGEADLNQDDGIHPTAGGHQILAENVWKVLSPMLKQSR